MTHPVLLKMLEKYALTNSCFNLSYLVFVLVKLSNLKRNHKWKHLKYFN